MKYAVLGTGMVGRAIAGKLLTLGNDVRIGTRDPEATLTRTEGGDSAPFAQWLAEHPGAELVTLAEAAAFGEIIVNATSGMASLAALELAGDQNLTGKVIVDIANPLDFSHGMPPTLNPGNTDSLGEQLQKAHPGAKVVKTLNTMNASIMVDPQRVPGSHNVFVSGDDASAKATVTQMLTSFGWPESAVIDLGGIDSARGSEMLLPIWLRLWGALGTPEFNFHIQGA